jgi:hypothetical protein
MSEEESKPSESSTTAEERREIDEMLGMKHSDNPDAQDKEGLDPSSKLDLDEETTRRIVGDPGDIKSRENKGLKAEPEVDPVYDEDMITGHNSMKWGLQVPNMGEVEVSENEKSLFLKQFLNEEPIRWSIDLNNPKIKFEGDFKSRNTYETDVIFKVLDQDIKDEAVCSQSQYMTMMQYYCASLQLEKLNGDRLPLNTLDPKRDSVDTAKKILRENVKSVFYEMSDVRWMAILSLLRQFEAKLAICTANMLNEDFWNPADSD